MRPLRQQQEPHHFIKLHPRSKRRAKGFDRTFEVIVSLDVDARYVACEAARRMQELFYEALPKGWNFKCTDDFKRKDNLSNTVTHTKKFHFSPPK